MTLRKLVVSGLFWAGGTRLLGQAFTWAVTIAVMRLLSPEDYGLLAMAMVAVNLLALLAEAGLGAAIVQAKELDGPVLRTILGAAIIVNVAAFAIIFLAAPAIAVFFGEERLVLVVRMLSLQFLVGTFAVVPGALLARRMDFRASGLVALSASIVGSLVTLALALTGQGVWALVAGTLAASLCQTIGVNILSPFMGRPSFALGAAKRLLLFGGEVTAARVLWFLYSQADMLIAGKLLGKEALGVYSVSMHLASLPIQKISGVVNQVALPAFARAQTDDALVAAYLLKALHIAALVAFPVLWGISAIAPEVVAVLLGDKWAKATLPLQLLPLVMPLTMASVIFSTAFQGVGRGGIVVRNLITACIVMPAAFWVGAHWDAAGLSLAWVLCYPVVLGVNFHRMLPLIGLTWRDLFQVLAPVVLASASMYVMVSAARSLVGQALGAPSLLPLMIGVGMATYGLVLWIGNRKSIEDFAGVFGFQWPGARS